MSRRPSLVKRGSQGCPCRGGHVPFRSTSPPRFLRQLRLRRAKLGLREFLRHLLSGGRWCARFREQVAEKPPGHRPSCCLDLQVLSVELPVGAGSDRSVVGQPATEVDDVYYHVVV